MGVYGGLFDPVHDGHLEVARYARTALELDKVLLVPCKLPNHRSGAQASGAARLHMLELASRDEATLEVSDIELEREGVSYTVDTLAQLRKQEPNTDFVFILGQDAFSSLPKWQRWQELLSDNLLAVVSRSDAVSEKGAEVGEPSEQAGGRGTGWRPEPALAASVDWDARRSNDAAALFSARRGRLMSLEGLANPLSSTAIRAGLAHKDFSGLAPSVAAYIQHEGLY